MVTTTQITPTQFLDYYSRNLLSEVINVKVGTEQRIYGKTGVNQGNNSYKVVYCVV